MKKVVSIFAIVMCACAIMTFEAMSATEYDPAVAAVNAQGVIEANKAQNGTVRSETIVIEDIAVPMAEAPDIISVPETTTTPESETTPVLAAPVDIEAVPAIQDAPETAASVEPEQAATVKEPEVIEETGDEFKEQEKEDKALALYTKKTLTFKEDGDIALVEEAGEDPEFMAICMMTIGKWFPTGDVSLYNPTENNLGPAIAMYEDEAGNKVTCLNDYRVAANAESEGTSLVLLRLVGQLENEGLADMVFRSDVVYNIVNASMYDAVTVENTGDIIQVSLPDREMSGTDFLTLIEGLQAQL